MRDQTPKRPRRLATAAAITLAMVLGVGGARAEDDDENVPLDTKLWRQFMKDLGLQRDGEAMIDYRERAPLVVPPSRDLPPPQTEAAVTADPAWPRDPDVKRRKAAAVKKKQPYQTAAEAMEAEGKPISRSELDRGKVAAGTASSGSNGPEEGGRPLRPWELGGKNLFSDMFSTFSDKGETGTFTGEPVRDNLTAPPTGYQTPSPDQPYGIGPKNEKKKALTLEQRTAGETR